MIHCPSCNHAIRIVDIRPGRFSPRCPGCEKTFQLTIPADGASGAVASPFAQSSVEPVEPAPSLEALPASLDAPEPGFKLGRLPRGTPRLVGRYLVLRLLGHSPRGKSLLARPLSLAGPVVLKLVEADRANDPIFVERHLREALASAQLASPYLAPIVEIGRAGPSTYTALEYLPGASLAEELARRGPIDGRQAAAWILQAARGLAVAHAQGIWHRDVKPENLRLSPDGLVVVDDLGLETTPSLAAAESGLDQAGRKGPRGRGQSASQDAAPAAPKIARAAVGTPIYMAPEQARDAILVDGRADIYSLGCTFYELVTGRPPYARANASELIAGHQNEPLIPPREFAPNLPHALSDVILTMTRKTPEERYPSMDVVIDVLENWLGLRAGPKTPDERGYNEAIQQAAHVLSDSPAARLRRLILLGSGGVWLAFLLLLVGLGAYRVAVVIAGFGMLTASALALTSKSAQPSGLVDLVREVLLGGGLRSWIVTSVGLLVLVGLVFQSGLACSMVFLGLCVGSLLGAFAYFVDRPFAAESSQAVAAVSAVLRRLRQAGYDERLLREKLAATAGRGWEPLFAAVFGDRAVAAERLRRLYDPSAGFVSGRLSWKGAVERGLASLLEWRRDNRLRRLFQNVEEARLEAEGLNLMTARRRSWRISKALILAAAEWRDEQHALAGGGAPRAAGPPLPQRLRNAVEEPDNVLTQHESHPGPLGRQFDALTGLAFGRLARLALGAVLLAGLAAWSHSHQIVTAEQVGEAASQVGEIARKAAENADPGLLTDIKVDVQVERAKFFQPLGEPWLPETLRAILAANLGAAGLLLVIAALFRSRIVGAFSFLAAAIILFGPALGLTSSWLSPHLSAPTQAMFVGAVVLVAGLFVARRSGSA
ncbi:MAG: serine/threonine-protein kinase [Paludisphaera borealis]|uniref:serine/threonine-protein kinase n=1 Tax=Paludisphaera borealis TaxID=1387353 RepID=UPI0028415BD9|nr:serine/threonine-protein kinase [Paludisphaera borealis]MDR3617758.1 serine/threonine-protein kinase [Paludisphaera borealis]